jgi:urease accessory protein
MSSATLRSETAVQPQRARGRVTVAFGAGGLAGLRQSGCGRCLFPNPFGGDAQAVVINTAGGLTGGDRFGIEATLGQKARLVVTTQAAERIYRSAGGRAEIANRVKLGPGASLAWLPQETILFEGAAMTRRLEVDLAPDARFVGLEALVLGRRAMGEDVTRADVTDHWRIRRGGRLLHAEALRLQGDVAALSGRAALLNGARAMATLVLVAPGAEAMLDVARGLLPNGNVRAAASAWDGRLVARFMAPDLMPLKGALARFLAGLEGVDVPSVWQI